MSRVVPTVLVDKNTLYRAGLEKLFSDSNYRIQALIADLDAVSSLRLAAGRVFLFILEVDDVLTDNGNRLSALRASYPRSRIVLMGQSFTTSEIHLVMRNGADACLLRTVTFKELVQALDLIMRGKSVFSAGLRLFHDDVQQVLLPAPVPGGRIEDQVSARRDQLTKRELQILRCLMQGESNKSIALRYCLTEMTVKAHMKAVLRKIGAANRTQAAIWAHQNMLLETGDQPVALPLVLAVDVQADARIGPTNALAGQIC